MLDYFNPENGVAVYERFCQEHFPNMLEETNYKEPGYFASVGAQAFVSDSEYGVLINERIGWRDYAGLGMVLLSLFILVLLLDWMTDYFRSKLS